jgi:hypothetical protein
MSPSSIDEIFNEIRVMRSCARGLMAADPFPVRISLVAKKPVVAAEAPSGA